MLARGQCCIKTHTDIRPKTTLPQNRHRMKEYPPFDLDKVAAYLRDHDIIPSNQDYPTVAYALTALGLGDCIDAQARLHFGDRYDHRQTLSQERQRPRLPAEVYKAMLGGWLKKAAGSCAQFYQRANGRRAAARRSRYFNDTTPKPSPSPIPPTAPTPPAITDADVLSAVRTATKKWSDPDNPLRNHLVEVLAQVGITPSDIDAAAKALCVGYQGPDTVTFPYLVPTAAIDTSTFTTEPTARPLALVNRKCVRYGADGHRVKEGERKAWNVTGADMTTLYGAHLIPADDSTVIVVESEKTALLLNLTAPILWPGERVHAVATSGGSGFSRVYNACAPNGCLQGHGVLVARDNDRAGEEWIEQAQAAELPIYTTLPPLPDPVNEGDDLGDLIERWAAGGRSRAPELGAPNHLTPPASTATTTATEKLGTQP